MATTTLRSPVPAFIGIGSNMGDKRANCNMAIESIGSLRGTSITAQSSFYRTEPVGVTDHDWYVNCVIGISTELSSQSLIKELLDIERKMGRRRLKKWDPRPIDLDIILFGPGDVIDEEDLEIPHPLMHERRFVLVPLVQIAPDIVHPVFKKSMADLLEMLDEKEQGVFPMDS